jgi:hypothetical protein
MQTVRLLLLTVLCCLLTRNGAAQFDDPVYDHPFSHVPGDDHGHVPAPAETEEGELPLHKLKIEAETWTACMPCECVLGDSAWEDAEAAGTIFACSRELFNSLHRLRI